MFQHVVRLTVLVLTAAPALGQSVRVIVVDTSGSMAMDNRLETAKKEILDLAQSMPPGKDNPIILVSFSDSAHAVTLTDLPSLKAHVATLRPGGGTNIASGLLSGLDKLSGYDRFKQCLFLLYSDGEDTTGNPAGVAAAEDKLDALFAARSKKGLPSLLFVKRWENAQGDLLAKIAKSGHAQVIDAKDLKIVPVTLTPSVKIRTATWSKSAPLTLEIEGEATLGLTGVAFDPSFPTAELRCSNSGVTLTPLVLRAGDPKPSAFRFRLALSRDTAKSGKATLQFKMGSVSAFPPKNGIILPQLSAPDVTVSVDLPPMDIRCVFSAALAGTEPATWADPLTAKPQQRLTLTCSIKADPDYPWPAPITIRFRPETGRILGKDTLEFNASGSLTVQATVEADPVMATASEFAVTLTAHADAPPGITVDPPKVKLTSAAPVPAKVETRISTKVQRIADAQWTDLIQGIAAFDADVVFDVQGPMPADAKVVLVCPAAVRKIEIAPAVLHTGSQTIRLAIQAQLPASPATVRLDFQIQPPPPSGAVRFSAPAPLQLLVSGPAALQLVLVNPDGASPSVIVRDRSTPILLTGVPVVAGLGDHRLAGGVSVRLRTGALFGLHDPGPVPVNEPLSLPLSLPADVSFFFDTVLEEEIEVQPGIPSPALVGSRQRCTVTLEAPFKKVCLYVVGALSVIAVLVILVRVLRPSAGGPPDDTGVTKGAACALVASAGGGDPEA